MLEEKRFAVLIDADNISAKYISNVLDEISNYGVATYKRIYGDWTKSTSASWKDVLLENSITPIQQYSYTSGKNATDSAMIIDAMDILYSGKVDGFCIVSSDSDFTKLSSRLRESAMFVLGMGEKKTPKPFIASCNQFKYLEVLEASEKKTVEGDLDANGVSVGDMMTSENGQRLSSKTSETNGINGKGSDSEKNMTELSVIKAAILKMLNEIDEDDQSMNMGELGNRLVKRYPDFDVRNYGDPKLSRFLRKFDFLDIHTKGNSKSMWVRLKKESEKGKTTPAKKKRNNRKKPFKREAPKKDVTTTDEA